MVMRETLDGFQGGLQIGGQMVTNLRYTDGIILLTTLEAELQEKEIKQATMPDARRRGRSRTAWMDNIKKWTGLPVEVSVRMIEDRDKWRKYVHGLANPLIEDG